MTPNIEAPDDTTESRFREWLKDPSGIAAWDAFVRCQNDEIEEP